MARYSGMFIETPTSSEGREGVKTTVTSEGSGMDHVYAVRPGAVSFASYNITAGKAIDESAALYKIPHGTSVDVYTIEEMLGLQWALCSYDNQFCYILANQLTLENKLWLPSPVMTWKGNDGGYQPIHINEDTKGNESAGEVWILLDNEGISDGACIFNGSEALLDSNFMDNAPSFYTDAVGEGSLISVDVNSSSNLYLGKEGSPYLCINYCGKKRFVRKSNFGKQNGTIPLLTYYVPGPDTKFSTETVSLVSEACVMNCEQVVKWAGSHLANVREKNYTSILTMNTSVNVIGYEIINGVKFAIINKSGLSGLDNYYIYYNAITNESNVYTQQNYDYTSDAEQQWDSNITYNDSYDYNDRTKTLGDKSIYRNIDSTDYDVDESNTSKTHNKKNNKGDRWYDVTLQSGEVEASEETGSAYLDYSPDERLPGSWGEPETLIEATNYNLNSYSQKHLDPKTEGGHIDKRQISMINRFKFIGEMDGVIGTKSFIFMTKPDLNLYKLDSNNNVIRGSMNPDLLRMPEFKYIGRNKDVGYDILDSLEYWGTDSGFTPWLSIITNQADGYTPIDREIGYTEVGETFHGHKVLYGKHNFKHNVAGTVSIPFHDRRDLSLYYTLKLWTEYIHYLNLGLVSPHPIHIQNAELDYAVSLYYIQTDETMENIIYWEKLTGVFPLKCPDSIFEWQKGNNGKNLEYSIEFAYSMRTVLRPTDLFELDRLYMKGASLSVDTIYPQYPNFSSYPQNSNHLAKLAAYFNKTDSGVTDAYGQKIYTPATVKPLDPESSDFEYMVNNLAGNGNLDKLSKYYYETFTDSTGVSTKFLANYCPQLQTHGVPYVKGPFIVGHPDYNGGKFLLKWV